MVELARSSQQRTAEPSTQCVRARLGFFLALILVGLFTVADWLLNAGWFDELKVVRGIQAAVLVVGFAGLRASATWGISVTTLLAAAVLLGSTAHIGNTLGDVSTTGIVAIVLAMGGASMMRWGRALQLLLVAMAAAAYGWNLTALGGTAQLLTYPAIATIAVLFASVCVARSAKPEARTIPVAQAKSERELEKSDPSRAIADRAVAMSWVAECDSGKLAYLSPSHRRVLGKSLGRNLKSIKEQALFECFNDQDRDDLEAAKKSFSAMRSTKAVEKLVRLVRPDEEERCLSVRLFPITDEAGQVIQVGGIASDITEQHQAASQLAHESRLSSVLETTAAQLSAEIGEPSLSETICRLTVEGLGCEMSHCFKLEGDQVVVEAGHGATPELTQGMADLQLMTDDIKGLLGRLAKETVVVSPASDANSDSPTLLDLRHGVTSCTYFAIHRGGQLAAFQSIAFSERQEPLEEHELRIVRGLSRLASLALEASQGTSELANEDRLRTRFIANMSHELRTPLTVIIGYNDMLLDGSFGLLNAQQAETLERVQKNSKEILSLFSAALQLAKFDESGILVQPAEVDVTRLMEDLATEVRDQYKKPRVDVTWTIARNLPEIYTDRAKLKIVLRNVIENALKFTDRGRVGITAVSAVNGVEFRVVDTGPGIDEQTQTTLFEPFRRANEGDLSDGKAGFGLGLFLTKRLIDALHGKVEVASFVGIGTTITVRVPIHFRAQQPRDADAPPADTNGSAPPSLTKPENAGEEAANWWERRAIPRSTDSKREPTPPTSSRH